MTPVQRERDRLQKRRVWLFAACFCVLVGFTAYRLSIFGRAPGMLDDELKGAARDGLPLTADDMARQTAIPASENGAAALEDAFAEYHAWAKTFTLSSPSLSKVESMSDADVQRMARYNFDRAQPVFDRITAAVKFRKLVFPRNWSMAATMTFPELADLKNCRDLLYFRFRLQESRGQSLAALDTLDTIAKLAALLGQDPTIIGIMCSDTTHSLACNGMSLMLRAHGNDLAVLDRCKSILSDLGPEPDLRRAVGSQFLMGLASARLLGNPIAEKMFGDYEDVAKIGRFGPAKTVYELRYVERMRTVVHTMDTAGSDYLKLKAALSKLDREDTSRKDWSFGLVHILEPAYTGFITFVGIERAKTNVLCSAIELLSRKAWSGTIPTSLPGNTSTSLDPFTGKPLIYKPSSKGFLIYSVGPDGKDNGGLPRGSHNVAESYDLPFSYP